MGTSCARKLRCVNAEIHTVRWGESGPRVVLVHGGAQGTTSAGHANFFAQEPLGDQGWQLIVPDRPGHGLSPHPGRPDDPEADGEWLAELLGDGAHLVGHSFGGLVALAAAAKRSEAVHSLTLIEPALLKMAVRHPAVRRTVLRMAMAMLLPYSDANRARLVMKQLGIPEVFGRHEDELASLGKSLKRAKLPSANWMRSHLTTVQKSGMPLLVISGDSNPSFIATCKVAAEHGGGRFLTVAAEHHFPQWAGTPFNCMLSDFWGEAESRGCN